MQQRQQGLKSGIRGYEDGSYFGDLSSLPVINTSCLAIVPIDVNHSICKGDLFHLIGVALAFDPNMVEIDLLTRRDCNGQFGDQELICFGDRYVRGERVGPPN